MEGRYRAYPEYKDSGVEWLGDVPEHWEVKKLKYIANISPSNVDKKTKREEVPIQLCNYTDVYYNDVIRASDNFMKASATEEQIKKFTLLAGDTIVTKDSEDIEDIAIPAFVPKDIDGVVCGYHLALIRPYEEKYGALIKRNFEATYVRAYMGTRANGLTRYGLGTYALSNPFFVQPPPQEVTDIANFLDHETAKIDTLIEKQQQLIALLKEKRQAVISHAVTKGLNPDAPIKDSGVEWLGEVPAHWDVLRLKNILSEQIKNGLFKKKDQFGSGSLLVNVGDLYSQDYFIKYEQLDRVITTAEERETYKVTKGDLFFVRSSLKLEGIATSACFLEDQNDVVFECHIVKATPEYEKVSSKYLVRYLNSVTVVQELIARSKTTTMTTIAQDSLATIPVLLPPKEEQIEIDKYLDNQLDRFDRASNSCERNIELLQERRTALISAAVTGKIDVRNWQPPTDKDIQ